MNFLTPLFQNVSAFLSADPSVLLFQCVLLAIACFVVFFVLYALRDILLRTPSFFYQIFCILLVSALPLVGFLLYLLIRPSRTMAERRMERKMDEILEKFSSHQKKQGQEGKKAKGQ